MGSLRSRSFGRILLIKPSAVGDVIHALPVLVKLRARYPTARIDWLLSPHIAELVRHHAALSNVILFERDQYTRCWRSWLAATGLVQLPVLLRRNRYDVVIDLHGQFRSAVLALASGAPVRIGFDRPRGPAASDRQLVPEAYRHGWTGAREGAWLAYTHRIPIPRLDVHAVDRYLWLAPLLGLDDRPPDMSIPFAQIAEARVNALFRHEAVAGKPLAILVPGTQWQTKRWHAEGFAEVAQHLMRTGRTVALAGSENECARCTEVAVRCPGVVDLCGRTTLTELAALIRRAEVCVTNDSGPMHLAAALGRPVVSVFGPTDPVWIGPYRRPDAVVRAGVSCAPCYLRKMRHCPHAHRCMTEVTAATVIERIESVLAAARLQAAG
jgi:lipopolysaccharide heptosyltransferase I